MERKICDWLDSRRPIWGSVLVIGFSVTLACSCLAQQASWATEHHDSLLVAPHATGVQFVAWPRGPDELSYNVQVSYPATRFWKFLCHDLKQKGWFERSGCSDTDAWWGTPFVSHGTSRTSYRRQITFIKENAVVVYLLDYGAMNGDNYLQMLHVQGVYSVGRPEASSPSHADLTSPTAKATGEAKVAPAKIDFGAVKLGSVSPPRVLTYTFRKRTEVQDIRVETSGEERLDFTEAATGSCRGSKVYKAGDRCTVDVTFAPRLAAERRGFVWLVEVSGPSVGAELDGTGIGESGQTAGPRAPNWDESDISADDRVAALMPDHPVELAQPFRITLKVTDPHVIGIEEEQGDDDENFITAGSPVGSGDAKIVSDTGLTKTMEVIPLQTGKLALGLVVLFADGGIAQKHYTLEVKASSKGLQDFFLNHGSHALPIVLEDKPQDRQRWLQPEVTYRQLEYPIDLEDSSQIQFTVLQPADEPVILLEPNGMVHGLRPGEATIIGDFAGVKDQLVVTVYTKKNAPSGYRTVRP